jgi:hypothetical protein
MHITQTNKNKGDVNNTDNRGVGNVAVDNKTESKGGFWISIWNFIKKFVGLK